ncbi:MAG: SAM-dependent methyltransferase [Gammaproteobacteria bacterium]
MLEFPVPSQRALQLSAELSAVIRKEISAADGSIPFSRYMELCLYTPGLGYYSAGQRKFGSGGDFVTAPEISPLFGRCIANVCRGVLESLRGGDILEFGAGSGRLAIDVLGELERMACLPGRYLILERSAELRQRQQQALQRALPELLDRVCWIDTLPAAGFRGVMLANEVLDAMAVERFQWDGKAASLFHVCCEGDTFEWCLQSAADDIAADDIKDAIESLASRCQLPPGYISEFNAALPAWLQSVAAPLQQGVLLLIDYGYPRHEYYHPQHSSGTLMCHYRQRAHDDPFLWPGLQDMTAHVDFTALAEAALAAGLEVSGYTTQAAFLLDSGLDGFLQQAGPTDSTHYLQLAQQAKTLILPGEMGERFKCMALTRDMTTALPGFRLQDDRHRL